MYLKDRIPTRPNRRKLTFEDDNSVKYVTIEYADEPLEEGTPMNAAVLDTIVPNGVILMWSGSSSDIPDGWQLCDGSNGTPDLRGRFILGASDIYPNKTTGGTATIDLSHEHKYSGTTGNTSNTQDVMTGENFNRTVANSSHNHTYSGTTQISGNTKQDILPPYYVLCYIMKISQIENKRVNEVI